MFDTFEPFRILKPQSFSFKPSRFEIWKGGALVSAGPCSELITGRAVEFENSVVVTVIEPALSEEVDCLLTFEKLTSQADRLQLISIPPEGYNDGNGIVSLRTFFGVTTDLKKFKKTTPYCCSLFTRNQLINKISFSFNDPIKLIEFYSEQIKAAKQHVLIARLLVELLIENYQGSDSTLLSEEQLDNAVLARLDYRCTAEDKETSVGIANSIFPGESIVAVIYRDHPTIFYKRSKMYTSTYTLSSLRTLLNGLDTLA